MGYGAGCAYCWWMSREYRWSWQARLSFWWHSRFFDHRRPESQDSETT